MAEALDRPRCEATITDSGEVDVSVGGIESHHATLDAALVHLGETAAGMRRPIKVTARDAAAPDDPQYLIVDQAGEVQADPNPPRTKRSRSNRSGSTRSPAPSQGSDDDTLAASLLSPSGAGDDQTTPQVTPVEDDVTRPSAAPAETEPTATETKTESEPAAEGEASVPEPAAEPVAPPRSERETPRMEPVAARPGAGTPSPQPEPAAKTRASQEPAAPGAEAERSPAFDAPQFVSPASQAPEPAAEEGWQGWVNRAFGMRLAPSPVERTHRTTLRALQQQWIGPRTIAVLNSKGGGNKTPSAVRLASEVARAGGGGVLAWDNNESLGTLGWRVEKQPHNSTALDLIEAAPAFLSTGAHRADLAQYVHHQGHDMFDALISDDDPAHDHQISGPEVDLLHEVAARNWRLTVMDSGNNTRGENFERMIHHADQIVLATTMLSDKAQGAVDSWRALIARGGHAAELAENAIVIASHTNTAGLPADKVLSREEVEAKFAPYVRAVHFIPFDPALVQGVMRAQDLRPATRTAWQAATAAAIEQF